MTDTPPTKVIFRKYPDGNIIALFPEDPGDQSPYNCSSYMAIGQHGAADPHGVIEATQPARPDDYADLKEELESIGYVLDVKQKYTSAMFAKRKEELKRYKE